MTLHVTVLRLCKKLVCPFCHNPESKLPLPRFSTSRALMTHVGRAHSISRKNEDNQIKINVADGKISYKKFRDVRRLSRVFEKNQHAESFTKWLKKRGYSF